MQIPAAVNRRFIVAYLDRLTAVSDAVYKSAVYTCRQYTIYSLYYKRSTSAKTMFCEKRIRLQSR